MHGVVLNSSGLKNVGIAAKTPTPPEGEITRKPGSMEPAGLLMETAFLPCRDQILKTSEAEVFKAP